MSLRNVAAQLVRNKKGNDVKHIISQKTKEKLSYRCSVAVMSRSLMPTGVMMRIAVALNLFSISNVKQKKYTQFLEGSSKFLKTVIKLVATVENRRTVLIQNFAIEFSPQRKNRNLEVETSFAFKLVSSTNTPRIKMNQIIEYFRQAGQEK